MPDDAPPPANDDLPAQIEAVAALRDGVRRALYTHVSDSAGPVTRDDAAEALGIRRSLAAFHLDKLVEAHLLEVEFRRLSGRVGPGAGRPAKLYRPSGQRVHLSLPPRNYELAARLFAQALEEPDDGRTARERANDVARRTGAAIGARARAAARGQQARLGVAMESLAEVGFEPKRQGGEVVLRNCPFHALMAEHLALVCGLNHSLMTGLVDELRAPGLQAHLDPAPGRCCVVLAAADHTVGAS
ncbi:MAG: transcriptional regulator [Frankiales bacterium]|nr:transcriptional regulator [Frankiales bacterium]